MVFWGKACEKFRLDERKVSTTSYWYVKMDQGRPLKETNGQIKPIKIVWIILYGTILSQMCLCWKMSSLRPAELPFILVSTWWWVSWFFCISVIDSSEVSEVLLFDCINPASVDFCLCSLTLSKFKRGDEDSYQIYKHLSLFNCSWFGQIISTAGHWKLIHIVTSCPCALR